MRHNAIIEQMAKAMNQFIEAHNKSVQDNHTMMILCAGISKIFDGFVKKGLLTHEEIKAALETETPDHPCFDLILAAAVSVQPPSGSPESGLLLGSGTGGVEATDVPSQVPAGTEVGEQNGSNEGNETPASGSGDA